MVSRRSMLRMAAATGAFTTTTTTGAGQVSEIRLEGRASGWIGQSPEAIAGDVNPTLPLTPGELHRVTWTNMDGAPHNFVVIDADASQLIRSDIVEQQGASQTVEVEATAAMTEYFCEIHADSMRGQITGSETPSQASETETPTEQPPVLDATTIVLGALRQGWLGLAPEGLRDSRNPRLRVRAGTEYELVWVNLENVEHDFHIANANGEDIEETSSRDETGENRETTFEAVPEMSSYYCEFHPQAMRGPIEIV